MSTGKAVVVSEEPSQACLVKPTKRDLRELNSSFNGDSGGRLSRLLSDFIISIPIGTHSDQWNSLFYCCCPKSHTNYAKDLHKLTDYIAPLLPQTGVEAPFSASQFSHVDVLRLPWIIFGGADS